MLVVMVGVTLFVFTVINRIGVLMVLRLVVFVAVAVCVCC